jgi:TrmH family RNA methyltransferase
VEAPATIPYVVLVRPREEGNVGAAARAMANMGLERLALVEPAPALGDLARAMGIGARHILDAAERHPTLSAALSGARRTIGTTSSRDRSLRTPAHWAHELPGLLASDPAAHPTALVFGPEVGGLNNDELALCTLLVTIPAAPEHPTLNLAQAVLLIAYELFRGVTPGPATPRADPDAPATAAAIAALFEQWRALLRKGGFARDKSFAGASRDLRSLLVRAAPNEREVRMLRGIARRLDNRLSKPLGPKSG